MKNDPIEMTTGLYSEAPADEIMASYVTAR